MRTGHAVKLTCEDGDGSPPPTYSWYKDGVLLPVKPSTVSGFQNSTYKLDPTTGVLVSDPIIDIIHRTNIDGNFLEILV